MFEIYIGDNEGHSYYVLDGHRVGVRLPDGTYKIGGISQRNRLCYATKEDGEIRHLGALERRLNRMTEDEKKQLEELCNKLQTLAAKNKAGFMLLCLKRKRS